MYRFRTVAVRFYSFGIAKLEKHNYRRKAVNVTVSISIAFRLLLLF